ncbi:hypothetical protein Sta7437_4986 (plasmid) [Stanieria cyanosphaera PCC 7437]|uniref:Uncharacterized protein n=1 Tax=Stanieria cyanosphaera (strain ATCC 29371 / PCC 7437) TaxID=111780 RepID=K9Y1X0_STAC7|nr:hypothetical protein [Stanieria cyanosphaera]AFZ38406.1 hypothetical protein Sta7437_4986 [Stanieria cyanosphaera PCC 7437]
MGLQVKTANQVKVNNDYAIGIIANISFIDAEDNEFEQEQFQFDFLVEGTVKPVNIKLWTGTKISGQKYSNNSGCEYCKLTVLCLQLGLCTEAEVIEAYEQGKNLNIDLDVLKNKTVKFKLLKSAKKRNLSQIDIKSLELIKTIK